MSSRVVPPIAAWSIVVTILASSRQDDSTVVMDFGIVARDRDIGLVPNSAAAEQQRKPINFACCERR